MKNSNHSFQVCWFNPVSQQKFTTNVIHQQRNSAIEELNLIREQMRIHLGYVPNRAAWIEKIEKI